MSDFELIGSLIIFLLVIRPFVWMYKYFKYGALVFEMLYKEKKTEVESKKEV